MGEYTIVTSPTYLIENIYQGKSFDVHHLDLYRLSEADKGRVDWGKASSNIALIEWSTRIPSIQNLFRRVINISIDYTDLTQNLDSRTISLQSDLIDFSKINFFN